MYTTPLHTTPLALVLILGFCSVCALPADIGTPAYQAALSHRSDDISAAQKKKQRRSAPPPQIHAPPRLGGPDPSFGPDGKPYRVPEYLRNQCYIDEGYGRFSACDFFN